MEDINEENKTTNRNLWKLLCRLWKVFLNGVNKFNTIIETFKNILFFIVFIIMLIVFILVIIACHKINNMVNVLENDVISVVKKLELNIGNVLKYIENLPNIIKNGVTSIF
jgi:uncharacterized membrane protein